jgi:predicted MFS family arabinose efflux permease
MRSIASQLGAILGLAAGGLVLAELGVAWVYWINAASFLAVILALILMGSVIQEMDTSLSRGISLKAIGEGLRSTRGQPVVFSSMLLDFFATFFSSATALLPIYTKDILHVGPVGYGCLASAQSVGAVGAGITLAFVRQIRRQGHLLLIAVAAFGLATVVFGVSRCFPRSPSPLWRPPGRATPSAPSSATPCVSCRRLTACGPG